MILYRNIVCVLALFTLMFVGFNFNNLENLPAEHNNTAEYPFEYNNIEVQVVGVNCQNSTVQVQNLSGGNPDPITLNQVGSSCLFVGYVSPGRYSIHVCNGDNSGFGQTTVKEGIGDKSAVTISLSTGACLHETN